MLLSYLCDLVGLLSISMTHSVFEKSRSVEEELAHVKPASTLGQMAMNHSLPVVRTKGKRQVTCPRPFLIRLFEV